jgi:UDP-N-acetylmuramoyl-tripeptide--D-alanyl-D-alanine ligase
MAELGTAAPAAHAQIAALAGRLGIDEVVAVDAPDYGAVRQVAGVAEAAELLVAELRPGDVVLVKASRSAGLERVAELVTR